MKYSAISFLLVAFIFSSHAVVPDALAVSALHKGEVPLLDYWIEYRGAEGVTTAYEDGILYEGFNGFVTLQDTILPERYFGSYPLYYTGSTMHYTLHIINTGARTYRNLRVVTMQEFLNVEGDAGNTFPKPFMEEWFVETIRPGVELVFEGSMAIPNIDESGLDQTHLQIFHWDQGKGKDHTVGMGRLLIDDPQAGIWCPQIR